jgi:CDP-diacylglycerol---glycerol-3-phosphate 3-phosphatidyltransferase
MSRGHRRQGGPRVPSVYDLKPAFQRMLRPIVRRLVSAGVTPNHLTLAAALGSLAIGAALFAESRHRRILFLLPAWLFARMALNAMDGMAAREHGMKTRFGGALNEIGDVVSDIALYLPLAAFIPAPAWPAVAFTLAAALTEFCGLLGPALGGSRRYEGPMGKSDRALLVGILGFAGALAARTIAWWPPVLWTATGLALLTCGNRVGAALREPAATLRT